MIMKKKKMSTQVSKKMVEASLTGVGFKRIKYSFWHY
jgi:hypothetical protein